MNVEVACTMRARLKGLIGRDDFEGALLLIPCNDIHTVAMRRPIDVAFIAHDGTVVEAQRGVGPNRRLRNASAVATLERIASNEDWYERGDRIQKNVCAIR